MKIISMTKVNIYLQVSADDQCALCGQLMGIAEFLRATLGKSSPRIYKFEHEKYAIKRIGAFSLVITISLHLS